MPRRLAWPWRRKRPPPPKPSPFTRHGLLLIIAAIALASFAAGFTYRATHATSPLLRGRPRVVDGDTLVVAGESIRLKGVDAPESGQRCTRRGGGWLAQHRGSYDCGEAATKALARYLRLRRVTCVGSTKDKYGRRLARCYVRAWWGGDTDVGVWLLTRGHAVVYGAAPRAYREAEARAKARKAGVWGGSFEVPALWRAKREAKALAARVDKLKRTGKSG